LAKDAKNLTRVHIVSFADSRLRGSRSRFVDQARKFGFSTVRVYDEKKLSRSFRKNFSSRLRPEIRGFGYWVWKPHIILHRLNELPEGDVLIYADVGFHIRIEGIDWFLEYLRNMKAENADFLAFRSCAPKNRPYWDGRWVPHLPDSHWSKGDLLDHLQMRNRPEVHDATIGSGLLFMRNSKTSRMFIEQWQGILENLHLVDDSPSISPNLEGFVENRHDQAALSLMLKSGSVKIAFENAFDYWFPLPGGIYWKSDWNALASAPFWARRDLRKKPEVRALRRWANHLYLSVKRFRDRLR